MCVLCPKHTIYVSLGQGCQTQGPGAKSGPRPNFMWPARACKEYNTIGVIVEYLLSIISPRLLLSDVVI